MPTVNSLGATFIPTGDRESRNRSDEGRTAAGEALRTISAILPRTLGPGAVAPDLLLRSQGGAATDQVSGIAAMIADAIVRQVLGETEGVGGQGGPLAALGQQIAPVPQVQAPQAPATIPLSSADTLSNIVRREVAAPTGKAPASVPLPRPNVGGTPPPRQRQETARSTAPPPRVTPREEPVSTVPTTPIPTTPAPVAQEPFFKAPGRVDHPGVPQSRTPTRQPVGDFQTIGLIASLMSDLGLLR